jgi:hypothetical protein
MAVVPVTTINRPSRMPLRQRGIRRASLWVGLPLLAFVAWAFQGGVQDPKLDTTDTQLVLKSLMLGQFVKANQWPTSEGAGTFDVAVHNKPALVEALAPKFAGSAIGAAPLRVLSLNKADEADAPRLLYTEATGQELDEVLRAVKGDATLVVTAFQPTLVEGVTINFFISNDGLKYEINPEEAEKRGILLGNIIMSCAASR